MSIMKNIKGSIKEGVVGISKESIMTFALMQTAILIPSIIITLIATSQAVATEQMVKASNELNTISAEELKKVEAEKNVYKDLYEAKVTAFEEYKLEFNKNK